MVPGVLGRRAKAGGDINICLFSKVLAYKFLENRTWFFDRAYQHSEHITFSVHIDLVRWFFYILCIHSFNLHIHSFNGNVLPSNAMSLRLPGWQDQLQIRFAEFRSSKAHILVEETNNKCLLVGYTGSFVGVRDVMKKWGRECPAAHSAWLVGNFMSQLTC